MMSYVIMQINRAVIEVVTFETGCCFQSAIGILISLPCVHSPLAAAWLFHVISALKRTDFLLFYAAIFSRGV